MVINGGPPANGGYPDPGKYTPDDLGVKKVYESDGRLYLYIPTSALRYLEVDEGDKVQFLEGGIEQKKVMARVIEDDD